MYLLTFTTLNQYLPYSLCYLSEFRIDKGDAKLQTLGMSGLNNVNDAQEES